MIKMPIKNQRQEAENKWKKQKLRACVKQTRPDKINIRKGIETQTDELKQKQVYPNKEK